MTGAVGGFFERCGLDAAARGQYFALVGLARRALGVLGRLNSPASDAAVGALEAIDRLDLSKLAWTGQRTGLSNALFDVEVARLECEATLARARFTGRVAAGVMLWLLETRLEDAAKSVAAARAAARKARLSGETIMRAERERRAAYAVGSPIDAEGEVIDGTDLSGPRLAGRHAQLVQHESQLREALLRGEHYLLVAPGGSGRTTFARRLAEAALRAIEAHPDPRLSGLQFVFVGRRDLLGTVEETRERYQALSHFMRSGVTAVIDDLEILLAPRLPASEEAIRTLGHELLAVRHPMVLVAEEEAAGRIGYLSHLPRSRLAGLSRDAALQATQEAVDAALGRNAEVVLGGPAYEVAAEVVRLRRSSYTEEGTPAGELRIVRGTVEMVRRRDGEAKTLDANAVRAFVSRERDLPKALVERDGPKLLAMIRQELAREVIGQEGAIETVARAVAFGERTAAGLRPRARLLLMGPPGVGKTHLAGELAQVLGYGPDGLIRLDMSEYSGESARTRFLGADPGYVGFGATSSLPDQVRTRPGCVILLDEIDRAHASIQDLLLAVFEGQCADASGRRVSFAQTVILATTNLGQEQVESRWREGTARGESRADIASSLDDATLRDLVLRGALDETERAMQEHAAGRAVRTRELFEVETDPARRDTAIDAYLDARERERALSAKRRHGTLDRAFLDRIDFVVPFLPIASAPVIEGIVSRKLRHAHWDDCPDAVRRGIINAALREGSAPRRRASNPTSSSRPLAAPRRGARRNVMKLPEPYSKTLMYLTRLRSDAPGENCEVHLFSGRRGDSDAHALDAGTVFDVLKPELRIHDGEVAPIGGKQFASVKLSPPGCEPSGESMPVTLDSMLLREMAGEEGKPKEIGGQLFRRLLVDLDVVARYAGPKFTRALLDVARRYLSTAVDLGIGMGNQIGPGQIRRLLEKGTEVAEALLRVLTAPGGDLRLARDEFTRVLGDSEIEAVRGEGAAQAMRLRIVESVMRLRTNILLAEDTGDPAMEKILESTHHGGPEEEDTNRWFESFCEHEHGFTLGHCCPINFAENGLGTSRVV